MCLFLQRCSAMKVSVRGISISSRPECRFFLKVEWAEDLGAGFVVMLCDGVSAWTGEGMLDDDFGFTEEWNSSRVCNGCVCASVLLVVSEEDVSREAQEMEMVREKYVHDLQLVLTGEDQRPQSYSFHLESESSAGTLLLSYEKVQRDVSVSGDHSVSQKEKLREDRDHLDYIIL